MNHYPEVLKQITIILEGLNRISRELDEATGDAGASFPMVLLDVRVKTHIFGDSQPLGVLRDEVGGSWSWFPEPVSPSGGTPNKEGE